ncbi:MAG: NosD domain-containing protein [Methanoregula sp.]|jgi:parallel beta-helix repeat protein
MRIIFIVLCIICACGVVVPAGATVWTVGPSGANYTAIQPAINGAVDGDTILVYPDTYTENLVINKTLNLTAVINEDGYPRINGGGVGVAVLVTAPAVNFSYFNVTNPTKYAIVIDSGSGRIANNTITSSGGGIKIQNSSGSDIYGNAVENSGGMYVYNTTNSLIESNYGATMSVTLTNSTYIEVVDNTIDGAKTSGALYYGLTLESSHFCTLYRNRVTNFHNYNLRLSGSHSNRIINNTISKGDQKGLYLYKSFDNILDGNYVEQTSYGGIILEQSKNSTLRNNRIFGCFVEFDVSGYYDEQDIDTSNVILYGSNSGPGSPIYYWIGKSHQEINGASNPGDVYLINCDHIALRDFNITSNGKGVYLNRTSYSTLTNVSAWKNEQGIFLENSSHNTIDGGWIKDNDGSGISLYNGNSYNVIRNVRGDNDGISLYNSQFNTVEDNQFAGISLDGASNNLVQRNTVNGLSITRTSTSTPPANNNTLYRNTVSGSNGNALFLKNAYDNIINETMIRSSTYGLYLEFSGRNQFDANNFTGNTYHIAFTLPPTDLGTNRMNVTNTLDGKPVYWLVNRSDLLLSNKTPVGALYGFNCTNITVRDQAITRNGDGAYFTDCSDITLSNITINATYNGISVIGTSGKNTITKSRITNITYYDGKGIYLKSSSGTTVSSTRFGNVKTAIYLDHAENNYLLKNEISTEGKGNGILLGYNSASNNTITMNNISENLMGINSQGINTNTIWFNNFVNNTKYYAPVNTPVWNSTSPVGYTYNANAFTGFLGNYWSNYTGSDSTGTGVGDTPYSASGITDLRPLVHPISFYTLNPMPAPVANFTANRTSGLLPVVAQFTDLSTGEPVSWDWHFGDVGTANTSTFQQPVHIYTKAGNYTVMLTATNEGGSNTATKERYMVIYPKGDFNHEWRVDAGDAALVAYMVVGRAPVQIPDADFNANGMVDIGDAAKIAYFVVGKIPEL